MSNPSNAPEDRARKDAEDVDVHTEAVAFDPFADDDEDDDFAFTAAPVASDSAAGTTESTAASEPANSDSESANSGTIGSTASTDSEETDIHTEAVPFDPFADDDEEDTDGFAEFSASDPDEITGPLVNRGGKGGASNKKKPVSNLEPGERSRREALSEFRRLRGTRRRGAQVAGGMVQLPFIPPTDPEQAVIDPADDIAKGVKPPTLKKGDIIAGQYEILGPIAHGGLGWVYIAIDHNVADRYVVLKGMMATENEHEKAVAESERAFLADITHPGIVKIFNFIDDPRVEGGFIVMEFVGGPSLRSRKHRMPRNLLEVDVAIGYILEILPALDYLHSRGVVYNDLKPDNIIITEDQVKLIDLGAVTGIGAFGHIFGTKGFQAPEIATTGPTVASDIYTVGRTLASLIVPLKVENGAYTSELPTPDEEPLFRDYMSLYRLLLRATNPDPKMRFASATAMVNQLVGVLREILAIRDRRQYAHLNTRFTAQRSTYGTKHLVFRTDQLLDGVERSVEISPSEVVAALPTPLTDTGDPGASLLSAASFTETSDLMDTLESAMKNPDLENSVEIPLTMVRAHLDVGQTAEAKELLDSLEPRLGNDWRFHWHSGIIGLLSGDFATAQQCFNKVLFILPGEPAPKLALAATDELLLQQQGVNTSKLLDPEATRAASALAYAQRVPIDDYSGVPSWDHITLDPVALRFHAMRLYGLVWATNPTTISSAFGLARQLMAEGLVDSAVAALDRVPQNSRHNRLARFTTILILISDASLLTETRIRRAARRLATMPTNEPRLEQIKLAVMSAALNWLRKRKAEGSGPVSTEQIFDADFTERGLRLGLERGLRQLARQTQFPLHRFHLVDMANKIRPRTWF